MNPDRHDAVIVGGGVVGAACALLLRQQGLRVALIERGAAPKAFDAQDYDLRVYALSPGSIQLLRGLGLWARIQAARASPYERMQVWENDPAAALNFDAAEAAAPALGAIVENSLLMDALWSRLQPEELFCGQAIASVQSDARATALRLADGRELRAPLVIAADGAESALREQAGIECTRWPYPQQAVVCHVQTERPHQGTARQRFLPTGPLALLPLADGRCSIVWSSTEAAALMQLEDADFRRALSGASQQVLGEVTACTRRVLFTLQLLHAQDYVRERLVLIGDAAHVIHPLAGQGVNLGLADVAALARVLAEARQQGRDPGSLRVLKRYERARKADNLEMLALTDALSRGFSTDGAAVTQLRRTGMGLVEQLRPLKGFFLRRALQGS